MNELPFSERAMQNVRFSTCLSVGILLSNYQSSRIRLGYGMFPLNMLQINSFKS